eukprot:scaffold3581_cov417-Prasinococcus_capsulatus_cf.AAC.8
MHRVMGCILNFPGLEHGIPSVEPVVRFTYQVTGYCSYWYNSTEGPGETADRAQIVLSFACHRP